MDGGAWQAAVHGVAESRTRLSDFQLSFQNQDAPALDGPGALSMEPGLSALWTVSSHRLAEHAEWGKELWFSGLGQGKQAGCHLEC